MAWHPPPELPEGQVARQRELRTALDTRLAILKDVVQSCGGLFLELEGGPLWEGLAVLYACRHWAVLSDLCQLFYQVSLLVVMVTIYIALLDRL